MENTLPESNKLQVVSNNAQITSSNLQVVSFTNKVDAIIEKDLKSGQEDVAQTIDTTQETVIDPLLTDRVEPEDLDSRWTRWKCLVCGFVYEGRQALHKCPKCGNEDPDKFGDID